MKHKKIPTRFVVISCDNNKNNQELILNLETTFFINDNAERYVCILRDFWKHSDIRPKEFVNIFDAKIEDKNTLIIDNNNGLIIVRPDVLIPITTLMMASFCMRKAWLSRMFQIFGEPIKALLIGTIIHEVFQTCIVKQQYDIKQIEQIIRLIIPNHTLDLYDLNMTHEELIQEIRPYINPISKWLKLYTNNNNNDEINELNDKKLFSIQRLHDVENNIWSTKYGFIGKIDLSLEVIIEDKLNRTKYSNLIPLELKTGRHTFSSSHTGQVILYSFIMTDKYVNYKSNGGYLLYLKDDARTEYITTNHNVFRDLILLRNKFVQYFDKLGIVIDETNYKDLIMKGPSMINSTNICNRCEHNLDCSLIYRCFDHNIYDEKCRNDHQHISTAITSHLNGKEMEFFRNWLELLEIERQYFLSSEEFVDFWNYRSEDCERAGIGLSKMQIKYKNEQMVIFNRHPKGTISLTDKFFQINSNLNLNTTLLEERRVVISEELINSKKTIEIYGNFCRQLCIMTGQIESFSNDNNEIVIRLEKDVYPLNPQAIYRIDFLKNISNRAMFINFSNLLRLMYGDEDKRAKELREIIINGKIPKSNFNGYKFGSFNQLYNSKILSRLNIQQKRCVLGILKTKCSLIFGSPGSGKTQTIVSLIQILVEHGYSVLVTSYTHVAVDNILMKLIKLNDEYDKNIDFIRLGSIRRINSQLIKYSDYERTKKWLETGNLNELNNFYMNIPVVSATCLGIFNHTLFRKRKFDFCIIDEASQVFLCTTIGPLFNCHNFVLVGDQKQLPPVVQSQFARHNGLDESLFSQLLNTSNNQNIGHYDDDYNDDVLNDDNQNQYNQNYKSIKIFPLFIQYRMNKIIMKLANLLTYDNKLKCANEQIERISLNDFLNNSKIIEEYRSTYLSKIISPDLNDSVIFIDTSDLELAYEIYDDNNDDNQIIINTIDNEKIDNNNTINDSSKYSFVINKFEARLILIIVQKLLLIYGGSNSGDFNVDNIGIISPFRRQVNRIRELFEQKFSNHQQSKNLEINTVDQYQGRDKDVIIYSCVKSGPKIFSNQINEKQQQQQQPIVDSELLKDERRLNVAVTRAKRKLIIIGNCYTLNRYQPFCNLFNVLDTEQQFVRLKQQFNNFDDLIF